MGTVFSFDVRAPGVPEATLDEAEALLHAIDATCSTYRPDSEINRLRHASSTSPTAHPRCGTCSTSTRATGGSPAGTSRHVPDTRSIRPGYVEGWAIGRVSDLLCAAGSTRHSVNGGGDVQCVGDAAAGMPLAHRHFIPVCAQMELVSDRTRPNLRLHRPDEADRSCIAGLHQEMAETLSDDSPSWASRRLAGILAGLQFDG
ncbi:MAG TPA: hypothetical protein VGL39_23485 [Jatrophihabitantaceae bacterium]|jgi:hypothetical protein